MAKVVIIDDSPTETAQLKLFLEEIGHSVLAAEDGESGIELVKAEQPEVVLMDVVMPGLNGFQATRQLTQGDTTSHIPVIIVTTKDQKTDQVWGQRQGAKGYLVKPVTAKMLSDAIDEVLSGESA